MRSLSIILLFILVSALSVTAQNKSEYYSYENDTTYNVNLTLKSNNAFKYNFKERGYCHICYFTTRQGTWSKSNDTIILLYTYSYEAQAVYPLVSVYDSLKKDFFLTVRTEKGEAFPNVKVTAEYEWLKSTNDYEWSKSTKDYLTDSNGLIILKKDSLKFERNNQDSFVSLRFTYKMQNGEFASGLGMFTLPYNIISFRICLKPIYMTEVQTIYYIKSDKGLTQVLRHNTTDSIDYWGDMKLCKKPSFINAIR